MNKLVSEYLASTEAKAEPAAKPAVCHQPTALEQVAELPEEEEEQFNSPQVVDILPSAVGQEDAAKPVTAHHKGVSDSSSTPSKCSRKSTAQQLFKQELQRRCESLIITSHKLIGEEDGKNQGQGQEQQDEQDSSASYTEIVDSRNATVAGQSSSLVHSGSTRDSVQGQDEASDVLATIRASQQRQESETSVNYIIDTPYEAETEEEHHSESAAQQDSDDDTVSAKCAGRHSVGANEQSLRSGAARTRAKHRRTDSSAVNWQALQEVIEQSAAVGELEAQEGGDRCQGSGNEETGLVLEEIVALELKPELDEEEEAARGCAGRIFGGLSEYLGSEEDADCEEEQSKKECAP